MLSSFTYTNASDVTVQMTQRVESLSRTQKGYTPLAALIKYSIEVKHFAFWPH